MTEETKRMLRARATEGAGGKGEPTKAETHSGWDWFCPPCFPKESAAYVCVVSKIGEYISSALCLKLKYLEYVQGENNFRGLEEGEYVPRWLGKFYAPSSNRHLSPSPGLQFVNAAKRYPKRPGDYNARYAHNRCVANFEGGRFQSVEFRAPVPPINVDVINLEYLEWLEESPSPSLPGEQDPVPKLADTIKWMSEGARRNLKNCETNLLEAHYEGYLEALEELSKEMELTPSAETGEQVEGKGELIGMLRNREKSVARVADRFPYWEGARDTFRWLIKHLQGESCDNFPEDHLSDIRVGDIGKPTDTQPSVEADQQVPEDETLQKIRDWIEANKLPGDDFDDKYEIGFARASARIINMYHKSMEQARRFDRTLEERDATIAVLRSSGQIALSEKGTWSKIMKGERDEAKRATIDRLYQQILASGEPFSPAIREVFHKEMNGLKTITNNTKDKQP